MHRAHALARYIAWSICTFTMLKFVRKGWHARCFTGLSLTRLVSSLPISPLAQISNKITHTPLWNLRESFSFILYKHAPGNTHTYIYIYIYTYICPREKDDVHIRVSTCPYKLGCTHTCMRSVHVRTSLAPSLATSEPLVTSVCYHRKKKPSAFTRSFAWPPFKSTFDTACDAHDNTCGANRTCTWCKPLSTYTFKSNRPCTSYIVFSLLVVSDGRCQKGKNRPTLLVHLTRLLVINEWETPSQTRKRAAVRHLLRP
jgi:hypothetical protein